MIPGSNLLKTALRIIGAQTLTYYKFLSRTKSAKGQWVSTYDTPIDVRGSFQPVPAQLYQQYGLDLTKSYFIFHALNSEIGIGRDTAGDQLLFNGKQYQCESTTDWFVIDKWKGVLCIETVKTLG